MTIPLNMTARLLWDDNATDETSYSVERADVPGNKVSVLQGHSAPGRTLATTSAGWSLVGRWCCLTNTILSLMAAAGVWA
jgi:hypothetical protein